MKNTRKSGKGASAEKIARLAERGEDVSRFFTNGGRMKGPIQQKSKEPSGQSAEEPIAMNPTIQLRCCICGQLVEEDESDGYSLQVRKFGAQAPEMVWAHGSCLRKVIPVIGVEIPTSHE